MNIVTLGHVDIDKNVSENSQYIAAGSPAMFMAKIFRQLPECSASIIAPYGKDFLPYATEVLLYPPEPTTEKTLIYENISKQGKRIQKAFHYEQAFPVALTPEIQKLLKKADILYIAPILPNISPDYLHEVTQFLSQNCLKILSPQGYFRQFDQQHNVIVREFREAQEVLQQVDVAIVSEQDHPQMKKVATVWAKKYKIIIIVTTGDKGAEIFTADKQIIVSTEPVLEKDIVDSVGSGDVFCAGFGYWYKKSKNLEASVHFANQLARECLFYTSDAIDIREFSKTLLV